jgi:phosphoribosylformylglycinamidine synthase
MIQFFLRPNKGIYALSTSIPISQPDIEKLTWLFGSAELLEQGTIDGKFIGPRKEMITPWSTNAVEITQNMGIEGIERIEEFTRYTKGDEHDPMLSTLYKSLSQDLFHVDNQPEPILDIEDISAYNKEEGLALNNEEIEYLNSVSKKLDRPLTDGEVFGFSQVNSEHCRHKIFNGSFIIDGEEKDLSLFQLIKKTSKDFPNRLVSAYKDNVAFVKGPKLTQFAPKTQDKPDFFTTSQFDSVISIKAETHNFPTTVEPFNGAATGSGGEIRDRLAGGKASLPLAGTAVYMTSYPRSKSNRSWEEKIAPRPWLYQTPMDILIKASNGASDFGNKFGQPLITGSLLTFENEENNEVLGYDKVIMLAGGVGYAKQSDSLKDEPGTGDKIVVMGGDNYRIGMGGGAVSSVATGEFSNSIELNAIQRSNPEMQKRVANAIRAMAEMGKNPIISIHDHGAGGHLNCLSELVETTGGIIDVAKLPVGDPTLSEKEIIGNESQERMGLVIGAKDYEQLKQVAERERAPIYDVGVTTGDHNFTFKGKNGKNPIDWSLFDMFGSSPKTIIIDNTKVSNFEKIEYSALEIDKYIDKVLQLEAVASKDWLTNKVDRSVTGKVAKQQTCGELQLPLNNVGVMALDYHSNKGVATSLGHAPIAALIDPAAGSILSITEALTNLVWAPIEDNLAGVSLSANWMWPCKNEGEDARLYEAVKAVSDFACALGINIPTGKDSLSMTQKYADGKQVKSPGTVIISAVGEVSDINKVVEPALVHEVGSKLIYIDFAEDNFSLGGSSFAQAMGKVGETAPTVANPSYFKHAFKSVQNAIVSEEILAGHDISAGGLLTALLEMCFPNKGLGLSLDLSDLGEDLTAMLFSEQPGILVQVNDGRLQKRLTRNGIIHYELGTVVDKPAVEIKFNDQQLSFDVDAKRDIWYGSSYLMELHQSEQSHAESRKANFASQPLSYTLPTIFTGSLKELKLPINPNKKAAKAAIIREKGVNGDREMAFSLDLAGFKVKDVHMTDLTSGRETLEDIDMIVFVGGFSNSDVLGSAKGWAGAFKYNPKAKEALKKFYARENTMSLGVCNGCQLMMELELLYPESENHPKMLHNTSGKFESGFVNMSIPENDSVMFKALAGSRLGVWVAHGEGKYAIKNIDQVNLAGTYSYTAYPGNPNGSDFDTAALCSPDGRHLAMMPHLERSIMPWHWPYKTAAKEWEATPWLMAFTAAREWVEAHK